MAEHSGTELTMPMERLVDEIADKISADEREEQRRQTWLELAAREDKHIDRLRREFDNIFERQRKQTVANIKRTTRAMIGFAQKQDEETETDPLISSWLPPRLEEIALVTAAVFPIILAAAVDFGENTMAGLPTAIPFNPESPRLREQMEQQARRAAQQTTSTTMRILRQDLADGLAAGKSRAELITDVNKRFGSFKDYRSQAIAQTEINGAVNFGSLEAVQQSGTNVFKEWLTMRDDKVRDAHQILDGERRPPDQLFSNGLMYPGDPTGPPSQVINCRCKLVFSPPL